MSRASVLVSTFCSQWRRKFFKHSFDQARLIRSYRSPKGDKAIVAWAYGRSQCVERQLVSKGLNFCGKWLEFNRVPELDPGLQATGDWEQVYVTFVGCDDRSRNGDYSGIFMAVFVPGEYEQNFSPNTQGQLGGGGGGQFGQGSQIGQGGQNPQQFNPSQQLGTGQNTQQFNPQQQGQFNPTQQQQQGQPAPGQFNTNQMQGNQFQPTQNQQLQQNPNAQALGRPAQQNTNQFQPQQQNNFVPSQNSQLQQNGQPQPQALGRPAGQQVPSNQFAPQNLQQNQPVQQAQAQPNQFVPNSNSQQGTFGSSLQQNTNNQLQPGGQPGTVQQNQFAQNNQQGGTPQSFQQNAVPQQPGQQQPSSQLSSNALPQTQQIQPGKPNPNKRLTPAQLSQLPKNLPIGLMQEAGLPTGDQGSSSSSSQGPPSQGLQNSQIQQSGSGSDSGSGSGSDPIDPSTGLAASTNWMGDGSSDSGNEFGSGSGTDVGFGSGSALDWYGWVGWYVEFYECNSDRELHGCNYEGDDNTDLTTFLSVSGASVVTCARAMLTRVNSAVTTPTRPTGLRTTIMMRASRTMARSKLVVAALLSLIQNGKIL